LNHSRRGSWRLNHSGWRSRRRPPTTPTLRRPVAAVVHMRFEPSVRASVRVLLLLAAVPVRVGLVRIAAAMRFHGLAPYVIPAVAATAGYTQPKRGDGSPIMSSPSRRSA
jgi:hypothetical protein